MTQAELREIAKDINRGFTPETKKLRAMILTSEHKVLSEHKTDMSGGNKTVCVSACLSFFGIAPDKYQYTSSNTNRNAFESVLRRFNYSVRSRASEFKLKAHRTTMTELRREMKKSIYTANDHFIVSGCKRKAAHLMVLNGNGDTIIDTAMGCKWRIRSVRLVTKTI